MTINLKETFNSALKKNYTSPSLRLSGLAEAVFLTLQKCRRNIRRVRKCRTVSPRWTFEERRGLHFLLATAKVPFSTENEYCTCWWEYRENMVLRPHNISAVKPNYVSAARTTDYTSSITTNPTTMPFLRRTNWPVNSTLGKLESKWLLLRPEFHPLAVRYEKIATSSHLSNCLAPDGMLFSGQRDFDWAHAYEHSYDVR